MTTKNTSSKKKESKTLLQAIEHVGWSDGRGLKYTVDI